MTDIVEGFRKIVQDLIVPEFKALQTEVKHNTDSIRELQQEMKYMRGDMAELKMGQHEILTKLEVDKRITKLETLMEQVLKKVA